ncbi:UDP-sugar transporter UST74c [Orchesella cincta]|uniref:UDP-sugar transporter UST74c n=1 Tax=Orchesella cincta TaxID=48709 RepID=A0A1D2MHG4_ORCCI|nr:UDP-sugar transporter UST74c [Orchesella cincta]
MPHVVDIEEKQPFLPDDSDDLNNLSGSGGSSGSTLHHHHHHQNNHHVAINHDKNCDSGSINFSSKAEQNAREARAQYMMKLVTAIFYAVASFLITVVNKIVLTSYKFPSFQFLAIGQICATIVVLFLAKQLRMITYPPLGRDSFRKIFPLPLIFIGNAVTGLGGTKTLSLPMFTALRRFSILMTMMAEFFILGVRPSIPVQISVYTMIAGALIASSNDLAFSAEGYTLVTLNNFFTAANGVFIKKKLESKDFGKYGLMFYNALFMFVPAFAFAYWSGEIDKALAYDGWGDYTFLTNFLLSCLMGFILNASVVLCTQHNSALTTTIIGCLKNISVTYLGMFIGGDYVFQWVNFFGINISVLGSLLYTYVTFRRSDALSSK